MQQLIAESLLPDTEAEAQYIINRTELLRLKSMGLVQDRLYVYFALKLTYDTTAMRDLRGKDSSANSLANVNIESFCEDWKLTESELAIAIAQLQKKGALEPKAAQLELELF